MSGVDKPIMDKAAELFGWAYGLGGFDVAVLEFVTFVRAQSDAQIAELEGALLAEQMHVEGLSTELAATKARGVVMPDQDRYFEIVSEVFGENICEKLAIKLALVTGGIHNEIIHLNAAPVQQVSVPDGWKLVPVEPTEEMIRAGIQTGLIAKAQQEGPCHWQWTYPGGFYRAMLAAAPAAPEIGAGVTTHE